MREIKIHLNLYPNEGRLEQRVAFTEPKLEPEERVALFVTGADLVLWDKLPYKKIEDTAYTTTDGVQRRTLVYRLDQERLERERK